MKRIVTGDGVVEWVAKQTNEFGNFGCARGIGLEDDGCMIAGVAYAEWNGVNVVCHIAGVGKRWMTREFLWTIFDYPFNQLKVQRLTGLVGEGNVQARRFDEHLGFELEARLEGAHPTGDLLIYRMRKPQCRWLNLKRVSHEDIHQSRLSVAA